MIREGVYEEVFANTSHGFRPKQKLPYRIDPYPKDIYRYKMVCGRRH